MHREPKFRIQGVRLMTEQEKSQRKRQLLGIKHDPLVPADDQFVVCLRALGWMNKTQRLWNRRMAQALRRRG
jgi:hypothetical protein